MPTATKRAPVAATRQIKRGDRWRAYICFDQAIAVELERDLIRQYSPRHNRVGNRFRTIA